MNHDEYLSRLDSATDADAAAVLSHSESCAGCRRDRRSTERALARLEGSPRKSSRIEELAIAIGGLSRPSWSGRSTIPAAPVARYRIVGGPAGVVAYTPTETIFTSGGGARTPNDERETHR